MAYTKQKETELIYEIVDRFGADNKVLLRRELEKFAKHIRKEIKFKLNKFISEL